MVKGTDLLFLFRFIFHASNLKKKLLKIQNFHFYFHSFIRPVPRSADSFWVVTPLPRLCGVVTPAGSSRPSVWVTTLSFGGRDPTVGRGGGGLGPIRWGSWPTSLAGSVAEMACDFWQKNDPPSSIGKRRWNNKSSKKTKETHALFTSRAIIQVTPNWHFFIARDPRISISTYGFCKVSIWQPCSPFVSHFFYVCLARQDKVVLRIDVAAEMDAERVR